MTPPLLALYAFCIRLILQNVEDASDQVRILRLVTKQIDDENAAANQEANNY